MTRQRRWLAAVALLITSTAAIAWLPALAGRVAFDGEQRLGSGARTLYLLLCAVAGASFLALARRAWRTTPDAAPHRASRAIWIVALALRVPALLAPPWLSDDVWRYLWEGEVQRAGFSPFSHAPESAELNVVADRSETTAAVRLRVTHPDIPAVYPPAAQLLFRAAGRGVLVWKLVVLAADLALVAFLLQRLRRRELPPARALLYAWHPLVVVEFIGSGHVDAIALLLVFVAIAASRADRAGELVGGACAGLAGMIKPQGFLPLIGFVAQRRFLALAAAAGAALLVALPFAGDGRHLFDGIGRYAHDWEFNGLIYPPMVRFAEWLKALLEGLPTQPFHLWKVRELGYPIVPNQLARKLCFALFVLLSWQASRRLRDRPVLLALAVLVSFLATAPAVHPWYVAWIAPFLPLIPRRGGRALLLLTVTTLVAGVVKVQSLATGSWEEPGWVALATWLVPCTIGAIDLWQAGGIDLAPPAPPASPTSPATPIRPP